MSFLEKIVVRELTAQDTEIETVALALLNRTVKPIFITPAASLNLLTAQAAIRFLVPVVPFCIEKIFLKLKLISINQWYNIK